MQDFQDARKSYDKAIEIERYERSLTVREDHISFVENHTWFLKGNLMRHLRRYPEALGCYDEALKGNPGDADTWLNKGLCLIDLGNYQDAIKLYLKALRIEMDPRLASNMWNNLGVCYYYLGDYPNAIESYDRAIEIDVNNTNAWYNKSKLCESDAQK